MTRVKDWLPGALQAGCGHFSPVHAFLWTPVAVPESSDIAQTENLLRATILVGEPFLFRFFLVSSLHPPLGLFLSFSPLKLFVCLFTLETGSQCVAPPGMALAM